MAEGLRTRGWNVTVVELDPASYPSSPPLETARTQFAAIPDGHVVVVDGLAFGTMPDIAERESSRLRLVPIVHMALFTTPGLTHADAARLKDDERRALGCAAHIVITGAPTRTHLLSLAGGFADQHITRIPPGVDLPVATHVERAGGGPVRLLCVANVTWGKGHDILLAALAPLRDLEWTLTCVGSTDRDVEYARHVRVCARELGLDSRIAWRGSVDFALSSAVGETLGGGADVPSLRRDAPPAASSGTTFVEADVFVLPTRSETYGMAVAEAIAQGMPVVSTRTGEIPSIVGDGGLLAEPGDVDGFASLLRTTISDAGLRRQLSDGARRAAAKLPTWDEAIDAMAAVLQGVGGRG
jgi:glycosyltransferase involved in cell wall biosynthesis